MKKFFHHRLWLCLWSLIFCFTAFADGAEPLTLEACLQTAFERNPELSQARMAHEESVLRVEQSRTRFFPSLDVGATAGYVSDLSTMNFSATSFQPAPGMPMVTIPGREVEVGEHENMNVSLSLKQPLYMGGRITHSVEASKVAAAIEDNRISQIRSSLRFSVVQAFYQMAKATEVKKISMGVRDLSLEHLKDTRNLVSQGMRLKSDLLPVELKRLQAELDIVQAENAELRAARLLAERIGISAQETLTIQVNWDETPPWPIPPEYSPEKCTRPEQDIVRKNLELAEIGIHLAAGEKRPEVSLKVASYYGWPGFINGDPEWTPWWQAGVNLNWNVFDMGGRRKKEQEAHIKRNRIKDAVRELDQKIALDQTNARLTYMEYHRKFEIAKEKTAMATENYRNMRNNYKAGVATNTDYLDAQTELANARNSEAVISADLRVAWADCLRALGKE